MCVDEDQQNELVEQARGLMLDICNDHVFAAEAFIKDNALRETLIQKIRDECQELVEYIVAAKRFNLEINSRAKDRVISFGEKLSCRFMASLLQDVVSCLPCPAVSWPCLRELAVPFWM
jgi:aspartate kinase